MNKKIAHFLYTGFYSGYCPVASGTAGSLVALAIYGLLFFFFGEMGRWINIALVVILLYPGIKLGDMAEKYFNKKDPKEVVLDEMIGLWIALLFFRFTWVSFVLAFVLFRFFDILKPGPINKIQDLKAGAGIMLDDYLAGVFSNICIWILYFICKAAGLDIMPIW